MRKEIKIVFLIVIALTTAFVSPATIFSASSQIDVLNSQIDDKRKQLDALEKEIAAQRKLLQETSGQASTLQSKINSLEATRKKITSDIKKTEIEIQKAELTINKLNYEIGEKKIIIEKNSQAIAESIRRVNTLEETSLVEKFLQYDQLSDFWNDFEQTVKVQNELQIQVEDLIQSSEELRETERAKQIEKNTLAKQKTELAGQKDVVEQTKTEQSVVLAETRNKEAEYQRLLAQKEAQKKAFESEILEIESQLKFLIDPNSYPTAQKGIFSWPLDSVRITQQFGGSQFAKNNPGIYGRAFHPGTDFGTPIGTKVYSIGAGTVIGTGNTDAYPGCYAWGKWILIKHDNGLSSLYAHLSSILVVSGQKVEQGESIALSGNTGVSTGPHLHLTLYASQGVKVGRYGDYKSGTGCAATEATGPFADLDAYFDPMSYLPSL